MFRGKSIGKVERFVWLGVATLLLLVFGLNFWSVSSESAELKGDYQAATAEMALLEEERTALEGELKEVEAQRLASQRCVEKFKLLADARNEYLLAGATLLEEFLDMMNFGIVAGNASKIFIGVPNQIDDAQSAITRSSQISCQMNGE